MSIWGYWVIGLGKRLICVGEGFRINRILVTGIILVDEATASLAQKPREL